MIRFDCPLCGELMEAPESLRGKPLPCPSCGELVKVFGVNPVIEEVRVRNMNKFRQHPIYEKQHWIVFSVIVFSLIGGFWALLHFSSWECKNADKITQLTQQVQQSYKQKKLKDTVNKYQQLEDFIQGRTVNNSELAEMVNLSRMQYDKAFEALLNRKRAKLRAQAQLNYMLEDQASGVMPVEAHIVPGDLVLPADTLTIPNESIEKAGKEY